MVAPPRPRLKTNPETNMTDETTRGGGGTRPASPTPQGFSTQATSSPTLNPTGAPHAGGNKTASTLGLSSTGDHDRGGQASSGGQGGARQGSGATDDHATGAQGSTTGSGTKAAAGDLKARLHEDVEQAREGLKSYSHSAMDRMQETLNEEAGYAARQVAGVADALTKVGEQLEGGDQAQIGRTARRLGETVQSFARDIEGKDAGEIMQLAENFGRRQPVAFLGMAALAGLAASRFITASSRGRRAVSGSFAGTTVNRSGQSGHETGGHETAGHATSGQAGSGAPSASPRTPATSAHPAPGQTTGSAQGLNTTGGRIDG